MSLPTSMAGRLLRLPRGTAFDAARHVSKPSSVRSLSTRPGAGFAPARPCVASQVGGRAPAARGLACTARCLAQQGESSSSPLTEKAYEVISDQSMDSLHEDLEVLCEEYGPDSWEVEYSSGVMTLSVPPHGTYVINKQPPNLQIWISSPLSGPSRFDWSPRSDTASAAGAEEHQGHQGGWVHHRDGSVKLGRLLEHELKGLLEQETGDAAGWEGIRIR
ncbi:iron donor protein CyaY [Kwoniella sp. DSM 27419]